MIKRTLYFGNPAYLYRKDEQLKIQDPETPDTIKASIPIEDIGVVVVDHPQVTFSHGLMASLLDNNAALIVCGSNHLPNGLLLPLCGNNIQSERFTHQINASEPLKKRLWQQTIIAKIANQGRLL